MTLLTTSALTAALLAPPDLTGTTWVLRGLAPAGTLVSVGALQDPPTLRLDGALAGARLTGSAGCNRYVGSAQLGAEQLKVSPLAVTRRACMGQAMNVERDFLTLLQGAERYRLQGSTLTVYARGQARLVFTAPLIRAGGAVTEPAAAPLSPAALAGTWRIQDLRLGAASIRPPSGAALTLQVTGDQVGLSGSAGCNRLMGRGMLAGQTLTFGGVAATRMLCADMAAERALTELLRSPVRVTLSGNTLSWRGAGGSVTLTRQGNVPTQTPGQPTQAASPEGQRFSLLSVNGRTYSPPRPVTLAFEGGRISGSDGCNLLSGSYALQGGVLRAEGLASTLMACPDLGDLPSLPQLLGAAPRLTLSGDTLTLSSGPDRWVFQRSR